MKFVVIIANLKKSDYNAVSEQAFFLAFVRAKTGGQEDINYIKYNYPILNRNF
jgi:hypothetical protein